MSSLLLRLSGYDERLLIAVVERRSRGMDLFMRAVTHLADWPVAATLALALALGVFPPLQEAGVLMAWTLGLSHLSVEILKRTFSRERPRLPGNLGWMVGVPDRFGFPSGHATAGMSLALPLALALGLPLGLPALALGICVGLSRCYLGVHFPSDVLAGWALSASVLSILLLLGV